MEMYIQAGQADRDPYWCEPWPSAIAMSEQLLRRPELVRGLRACELGCGLGLAGLAAAVAGATAGRRRGGGGVAVTSQCGGALRFRRGVRTRASPALACCHSCSLVLRCRCRAGAAEVVLLDREPLALQCALLNAAINGLPVAAHASAAGVQAPSLDSLLPFLAAEDVERLQQHQQRLAQQQQQQQQQRQEQQQQPQQPAAAAAAAAAAPGRVRAELFDWSQPVTLAPHDVCLVCDCLYEAFSVQVRSAFSVCGCSCLCAEALPCGWAKGMPRRWTAGGHTCTCPEQVAGYAAAAPPRPTLPPPPRPPARSRWRRWRRGC